MTKKIEKSRINTDQNSDAQKKTQRSQHTDEPAPPKETTSETTGAPTNQEIEKSFPVVGMGASAGGLEAIERFFGKMPSDSGIAFVIVMHFDPRAKSVMPDILKRYTKMEVLQVEDGMKIRQDCIYIIPPNKDMAILHGVLHLYEPIVRKGIRHPIDFFFRSLADDLKERAICIILSGTGTEGTLGLKAIKGEGGMVMVQSVESAAYDGMPRSAIETGLVDFVLPPEKMPEQLVSYVKQFYAIGMRPERVISEQIVNYLQKIVILIREQTGVDFSQYKQGTLIRRIERRMNIHKIDKIADYIRYLQDDQAEAHILYKEFLIGVTNFFRDHEAFENLKEKAVPEILKDKTPTQIVRIWVTACSTGEEAYSIAIILKEYMDEVKSNIKIQVFATDIDRDAIEFARAGVYPENIAIDVSLERLARFFVKKPETATYSIKKEIREMVVFAPQNVISDPPFLKMDLISCRNLLIYLVSDVQKKILHLFHYSLNPGGFLFLGSSETIGELTDLYSAVDKKWKIFKRLGEKGTLPLMAQPPTIPAPRIEIPRPGKARPVPARTAEQMEKLLLNTYTPPCVIVDDKGDILYIHGRTGKYLEPAPGRAMMNVLEMAREGIRTELNIALHTTVTQKKDAVFRDLSVKTNGDFQALNLTVRPVREPETMAGLILIIFEDVQPREHEKPQEVIQQKEIGKYVSDMENELKSTKENLQAAIEELQASNEELRSTNEELQSSNEELQSTNEELNASKEELQSLNEELVTLNAEHQTKIEELSRSVSDLNNVLSSTEIATVFLDNDMNIKSFTPIATRILNLIKTDIDRPISDIATNLVDEDLARDANEVLETLALKEKEVEDTKNKKWYLMRILPYRTAENIIDGVVVSFIDITQRKRAEELLQQDTRLFAQSIVDTMREPLLVLDKDLKVISANPAFYQLFKVSPEETEKTFVYDIGNRQWDIPKLRELLEEILPKSTQFENFEVEHHFPTIGRKIMLLNARRVYLAGAGTERILLVIEDITERKQAELQEHDARLFAQSIVDTVWEPLLVMDKDLHVITANRSFYNTFQVSLEETENKYIYDIGNRQWDIPKLRELLEEILPKNTEFNNFEVEHMFPKIGRRVMLLNARRIYQAGLGTERILLAIEDITGREGGK